MTDAGKGLSEVEMRLQLIDESVNFSCGSCTFCCDQPWRTLIEIDKAEALSRHDFGAYPQLSGRTLYRRSSDGNGELYELSKGEGTRCLFLDTDGLCIIHKELGAEAKPGMCRQFPYLSSRTWTDDRVSANFGCPSVQKRSGSCLSEQAGEIASVVPVSARPARPDQPVMFDMALKITPAENGALLDRAIGIFEDGADGNVWDRFAKLLGLLVAVGACKRVGVESDVVELLRSGGDLPNTPQVPPIRAFEPVAAAPMPIRFLFAATLYPDTVPADAGSRMGLFKKLSLVPKLMSLAQMSGSYASRVLGRNVAVREVLEHEVAPEPEASALLLRYFRSRFWHRTMVGTRLPIVGGVHQHVQDLNAIIFFARAEAQASGARCMSVALVRRALTAVEFHLANQPRLHEQTLKGRLRTQLCDPELAMQSLRLMAPARAGSPVCVSAG
ncbi:MAG: YkgJ family cysteine cluster protein [Planctomycetota bacterium]|nr:YkgJ family cysteine cluster protein [Planctomycetota bacterium]